MRPEQHTIEFNFCSPSMSKFTLSLDLLRDHCAIHNPIPTHTDTHNLYIHVNRSFVSCQIHLHAGTDKVMNVTFIRAPPTARLKVNVPLVFIGEDACPGIRKGAFFGFLIAGVLFLLFSV